MTNKAIWTEGLTKRYGAVTVLSDLNLEIDEGQVVGYLGPDGAGKTTTVRLLLGLIQPTVGRGEIFGLDCRQRAVEAHRKPGLRRGRGELVAFADRDRDRPLMGQLQGRVDEAYRQELIARFELDPSKKVRAHSRGNRQRSS